MLCKIAEMPNKPPKHIFPGINCTNLLLTWHKLPTAHPPAFVDGHLKVNGLTWSGNASHYCVTCMCSSCWIAALVLGPAWVYHTHVPSWMLYTGRGFKVVPEQAHDQNSTGFSRLLVRLLGFLVSSKSKLCLSKYPATQMTILVIVLYWRAFWCKVIFLGDTGICSRQMSGDPSFLKHLHTTCVQSGMYLILECVLHEDSSLCSCLQRWACKGGCDHHANIQSECAH